MVLSLKLNAFKSLDNYVCQKREQIWLGNYFFLQNGILNYYMIINIKSKVEPTGGNCGREQNGEVIWFYLIVFFSFCPDNFDLIFFKFVVGSQQSFKTKKKKWICQGLGFFSKE